MFRLRRGPRNVRLVGGPRFLAGSPGEWLRGLRWFALLGMLGTTLLGKVLVPGLKLEPVLAVLVAIAFFNTVGTLWKWPRTIEHDVIADAVALGLVLWFSGGTGNPFVVFLTFQVTVAGILASPAAAVRVSVLVVAIVAALLLAPPLPWASAGGGAEEVRRAGQLAATVGVALFVGVSSYAYGQKLEELRAETARAARFADLGRVGAAVGHELNTPLATILVASQELVAEVKGGAFDQAVKLGEVVADQAKRASDTIALLRGQVRTDQLAEAYDVGMWLEDFVPAELSRLGYAGRSVVRACSGEFVWAIPGATCQIVANLLKNAVEATSGVPSGHIRVSATRSDRGIVITVSDNGCGIRPDDLQRLGQPFHTTKSSTGGAGMGLYVSALLARQMDAELEVAVTDSLTAVSLTLRVVAPAARSTGGTHAAG